MTYIASFKKPKSGRLWWAFGTFNSEKEATEGLRKFALDYDSRYLLYGGPLLVKPDEIIKKQTRKLRSRRLPLF